MSKGFTFEKNLPHQKAAVDSVTNVFVSAIPHQTGHVAIHLLANPELNLSEQQYYNNIKNVQEFNGIDHLKDNYDAKSNVIDVSMETGTGKTYTYTKTIFDLNKSFGINKFIIIVPTLSVKAGTVNFLKSDALKEHFRDDYERELKTYVVESQKSSGKNTKSYMPQAIHDFVEASNLNKRYIHVLVINSGMINSKSLTDTYDVGLLDNQFDTPFAALGAVKPFIIIDEPHKFPTGKKTWENIEKINAQYIIRYGATFSEGYKNLVYRLTAVDAFNEDLVKGIDAYIEDIVGDGNANLRFVKSDGKEATFELNENNNKKTFKLAKGESLSRTHSAIHDLTLDALNKSTAVLSNGIELKIGSSINPYSYDQTLADNMMRKAVKEHFKLEKEYLTQRPRIKPLTLFFIDDIEGYRDGNDIAGSLKTRFEEYVLAEANELLKIEKDEFYRNYLEKTVKDISSVHGGYFSKDNSDKDDKVEQEITEILHDKELLLSLENPRRFIFSKWTLREGWDNPNVFQICKLRSSGSTTSKLQEVGRGLRLPVNEYMCRVKDRNFTLNYYVDFTEKDFVDSLVKEINDSSFKETVPGKFTQELKDKILSQYPELSSRTLLNEIFDDEIIDDNDNFKDSDAYSRLKARYPAAFPAGVKPGKIKKASDGKRRTKMRVGKFSELKELWDLINQKVVIEYKIKSEREFLSLFRAFMLEEADRFTKSGAHTRIERIYIHNDTAMSKSILSVDEDNFPKINTMSYREFLDKLSQTIFVKHDTMHKVFCDIKDIINITEYLNIQTIRKIKSGFSKYLLNNSFSKFSLGYNVISGTVHPTKFTNADGGYLADVLSSDLGVLQDNTSPPLDSYLFEEVFYDSELEKLNMTEGEVRSVIVFTKIPKNSIKIPVAGGYTYSPDFAYVVNTSKGDYLNLIIETKNVDGKRELRHEERDKIKHAQKLFEQISKSIKITFMTQFSGDKIHDLIKKLTQ
ncbi:type III restriction-modification system endonuclease [Escherichia coli]|nr:type III restriction-modification system endonuclease [Escherichia coli]EFA7762372.1 type III restriction-modification system endonuclease [Escherichia coli]EFA7786948.1 type III restriction-modification system endonuclease [Escherichia coli]EFA7793129.1 type III restriction-modification system endonuclease [Escherichia coli]EFA7808448.1 type III restriction-modification system endonuclease [Escherichia coli]